MHVGVRGGVRSWLLASMLLKQSLFYCFWHWAVYSRLAGSKVSVWFFCFHFPSWGRNPQIRCKSLYSFSNWVLKTEFRLLSLVANFPSSRQLYKAEIPQRNFMVFWSTVLASLLLLLSKTAYRKKHNEELYWLPVSEGSTHVFLVPCAWDEHPGGVCGGGSSHYNQNLEWRRNIRRGQGKVQL